ncbi:MAG: DUF1553 domain-containing protein [Planctomycetales bacterium]|nr:DUF1553 domain-containing protein [Planctomycetales bacterium]
MRETLIRLLVRLLPGVFLLASTRVDAVDFETDVLPILKQRCFECHGESEREGGLRLTNRADAFAVSDSGKSAIVPGDSGNSELIARIQTEDEDLVMPAEGERLSHAEVQVLTEWIQQGAVWPVGRKRKQHWAYVPPVKSPLPDVDNASWPASEIDFFALARLEAANLSPTKPASRERLLRRLYLDLIGLPPSVEEVRDFVNCSANNAVEDVVDRLLASPRFGEKWARGWLDLARYSDSNGYQADQIRSMWAYRNWVIDAMNDDMPFDQFTIEQLAGDLLPDASESQRIATGFHRATTCNVEAGVDPEGNRTDQVIDRVNTTATVWLGTTLECAQCHNHKYDPFSQQEYYQIFAFFNNTPMEVKKDNANPNNVQFNFWGPKLELDLNEIRKSELSEANRQLADAKKQFNAAKKRVTTSLSEWEASLSTQDREQLPEDMRKTLQTESAERTKSQRQLIINYVVNRNLECSTLKKSIADFETRIEELQPDTTLVMVEMDKPRETNIFIRGEFLNKGPSVVPDVPSALHAFEADLPANRLGFAKWLASRNNPLVARVVVNRWWAELFGNGLVRTSEDFGSQGDSPSHPRLLDWLAVEFMENGWSMKHVLKKIVMSSAYQQDSAVSDKLLSADPNNRLLSRGPRFRLPAETIRDNALAVSGLLSTKKFDSPIYPPQPNGLWKQTGRNEPVYSVETTDRRYGRGIYVVWRRAAPYPSFVNFDAPDRMSCTVQRPLTNTPLQALTLLNDEAYVEAAKAFAAVIATRAPDSLEDRIEFAFGRCLARAPTSEELTVVKEIYEGELARIRQNADESKNIIGSMRLPDHIATPKDRDSWAAWFCVANVLLNLDETISKN